MFYCFLIVLIYVKCVICYKAYLFIGPHKTGSSEVESIIFNNHEIFKFYYNITVIGIERPKESSDFVKLLENHEKISDTFLLPIQKNNSDILIASESFSIIDMESLIQFKNMLHGYNEVIIIANHRAYLNRERSSWCNTNKPFRSKNKYIENIVEYLNYDNTQVTSILSIYAKVFGKNSIKLISFEGSLIKYNHHPASLFMGFIDVLKFDITKFNLDFISENPSPSVILLDTVRYIQLYSTLLTGKSIFKGSNKQMKIIEYAIKYIPSRIFELMPNDRHIEYDLQLSKIYEYYFPPLSNDVYKEPLKLELFCVECLSSNKTSFKYWNNMIEQLQDT